jgi:very-short-patch-repair endonuclease
MDVAEALGRIGGVADRRALLALCSRRSLESAVERGAIVRLGRSQFVLPTVDEARVAAASARGVMSHLSASLAHGWKVKAPPAQPQVSVRRTRGRVDCAGSAVHWTVLRDEELAAGVTAPLRTVIDCARALPFDEALAVADSALRSGTVRRADLLDAAQRSPRTGRAAALRVATLASPKAANPFESVLRAIALAVPGLDVVPQGPVGGVGHADLTDPVLKIAIEAESFEFHALPEAFRYDVRRYTEMTRRGWLVARFVWEDVMERPDSVAAVLADLVALRTGHPPRDD